MVTNHKIVTDSQSRKARRKEERSKKKRNRKRGHSIDLDQEENNDKKLLASSSPLPTKKEVETKRHKKASGRKRNAEKEEGKRNGTGAGEEDPYENLDPDIAAGMRRDDEEIAALEAKLGLARNKKEKMRLKKEYAKLEGYGDDFGDFLDDLDHLAGRISSEDYRIGMETGGGLDDDQESYDDDFEEDDEYEEEDKMVPMKDPAHDDLVEDDSVMDEIEAEERGAFKEKDDSDSKSSDDEEESDGESADKEDPDHDSSFTYQPTKGEDIYGKKIDNSQTSGKKSKYVPPHMRKKEEESRGGNDDKQREEALQNIRRSLNSTLNRLSEDTLVSVSQSIAQLYSNYPSSDVNECFWNYTCNACVAKAVQMTALIPVYVAALAGVHVKKGDTAQLGEYVMEMVVLDLARKLESARGAGQTDTANNEDESVIGKEASNLMLLLCYLYNFNIIHCTLIYDIIRELIRHFEELDVEMLLLILSHSGRALRSDDPSSLKEIVLLVQKRALEVDSSSRVDFMVSAMMDLKNNKKRKQDVVYAEKTAKLRKMLGKIKSMVATGSSNVHGSDSSLRITLNDIRNSETNGRWWKVGASWVGNQNQYQNGSSTNNAEGTKNSQVVTTNREDEKLLKLAAKYRMNTDVRRSIFCIIMGSADCDDSFEKLARTGMLKNRTERETVRVLMECCGNEKSYNKYYCHLASRICEFQPQCSFSFQLAYWDLFKQFEELKVRKAANLAKLLFHLVAANQYLKLDVLKAIDMSSPEELPETAMIFLTIFFSTLLEHFNDQDVVSNLFKNGITQRQRKTESDDDLDHVVDDSEALRANLTVFFVQILKSSPKYKKGSKFRSNLKAAIKACDTDNFFAD